MITIDGLKNFGAATDEGLARCMNNEEFYIKMVAMALDDDGLSKLKAELDKKDLDAAFEVAHALKGVYGNLALTPIFDPVNEITELLRSRTDTDYSELYGQAKSKYDELIALKDA